MTNYELLLDLVVRQKNRLIKLVDVTRYPHAVAKLTSGTDEQLTFEEKEAIKFFTEETIELGRLIDLLVESSKKLESVG